jgi:hypothetical protein
VSRGQHLRRPEGCYPWVRRSYVPDGTSSTTTRESQDREATRGAVPREESTRLVDDRPGRMAVRDLPRRRSACRGRFYEPANVLAGHRRPCTCVVGVSAGHWFEHGSNVCPGLCGVSRWLQVADLRRWLNPCPEMPVAVEPGFSRAIRRSARRSSSTGGRPGRFG